MKFTCLFLSLFAVLQLHAQDFTGFSFQSYTLAAPIVADFDGDDKPDLFGLRYVSGVAQVGLLVNNSAAMIDFTVKDLGLNFSNVAVLTAADFEGDSVLDIVASKGADFQLFILHNDGEANFTIDSLGVAGSNVLKVADIDNDSDLDIIGINTNTNQIQLYLNDGALNFTVKEIPNSVMNLKLLDIGDMDNDGDIDIVLGFSAFSGLQIALYKNTGDTNFELVNVASSSYSSIEGLLIDDINSDGNQDIVTIKSFSCDAFLNQGNLSFMQKNLVSPGAIIRSVRTGDFNGDGKRDFVLGKNSTAITWHKNLSNSTLEFETHTVGSVTPCFSVASGDLDGDGDEDLVVHNGTLWWYVNDIEQEMVSTIEISGAAISISPNPFTEGIHLKNPGTDFYALRVSDQNGKTVYTTNIQSGFVDLSHLNPGLYFLSLINAATQEIRSASIIKGK